MSCENMEKVKKLKSDEPYHTVIPEVRSKGQSEAHGGGGKHACQTVPGHGAELKDKY